MNRNTILWTIYAAFALGAFYFDSHDRLFDFTGRLWPAKSTIWAALAGFVAYSAYCSAHENLFRTVEKINEYHWGRQIGIDLYLGLMLLSVIIYLQEGSLLAALVWIVPALFFVNLVTLLYFAIHFDALVARFFT